MLNFPQENTIRIIVGVGAHVAVNHASTKVETANSYHERKETKTGMGVMAGVSYEVTPNVALDAGYHYNH
ncbi:opacity family porin [Neisseria sicca]|mgnify:FL=1|uniref:opacity family porin n=1 Tax=Neisseria TaxID=482 RepID=UPI0039A43AE2